MRKPTVVGSMARADLVILARSPDVMRGRQLLLDRPLGGRPFAQVGLESFAVELRIDVHVEAFGQSFLQHGTRGLILWQ